MGLLVSASYIYTGVMGGREDWRQGLQGGPGYEHYMNHSYTEIWGHIPSYWIGAASGAIWSYYSDKIRSLLFPSTPSMGPRGLQMALTSTALFLMGVTTYGAYHQNVHLEWSLSASRAFLVLSVSMWSVGVATLCFLVFLGRSSSYRGPYYFTAIFLEWRFFTVMSRLTFLAYLIHPMVIYMSYSLAYVPFHFNRYWMQYNFISISATTYLLSLAIYLLVSDDHAIQKW